MQRHHRNSDLSCLHRLHWLWPGPTSDRGGLEAAAAAPMFSNLEEMMELLMRPPTTREELIRVHNKALEQMKTKLPSVTKLVRVTTGSSKPKMPSLDLSACSPINISKMKIDNTHFKKCLRCTIIVEPLIIVSIQTIVEDENGDVAKLCIYNAVDSTQPGAIQEANILYPKGRKIIILEPYFKKFQDNTFGIRVDKPQDIIYDDIDLTRELNLKQESNEYFKNGDFEKARSGYSKALDRLGRLVSSNSNVMLDILNNISATYLRIQNDAASLVFAYGALVSTKIRRKPTREPGRALRS